MKALDLRKKVGQLMVFGFKGTEASEEIKELIRDYHVGGIILFGRNIGEPKEVLSLTTELQREAQSNGQELPLLICIDQENGVVRRLGEGTTVFPGAMLLGATNNPENAYEMGVATGKELKALGVNWNLAPVVDVNNNPLNPVIGVRSYGEYPESVAAYGKAAVKGMQEAGVITTLKHFPGHGDTDVDSHLDLPVISHDMKRLQEVELKPFIECINDGADTVMSAHVLSPTIEKNPGVPATLSHDVITGLLRSQLGFQGVVTTDCMEMNAIADTIGTAQGAVEAIKAGVDLIMVSHRHHLQKESIELIVKAVESGEIEEKVIDDAYERVMKLKGRYLKWDDIPLHEKEIVVPEVVGSEKHKQQALRIFLQGVTVVKSDNVLPLSNSKEHNVLVIYPENTSIMQVEDRKYSNFSFGRIIQEVHPSAQFDTISNPPSREDIDRLVEKAREFETIIVGTLTASTHNGQVELIEKISGTGKKVVVVAMRSPYDYNYMPNVHAFIATYEFTHPALKVAAETLYGIAEATGSLPVTVLKSKGE